MRLSTPARLEPEAINPTPASLQACFELTACACSAVARPLASATLNSRPRRPFCKITRFYHFAAAGPARPPPNSSRASAPTCTQPRASTTTSHVLSGQRGGLQQATAPARRRHWHVGPARAPRACGRASSRSVWMASGWRGHRPLAVSLSELSFLPLPFGIWQEFVHSAKFQNPRGKV